MTDTAPPANTIAEDIPCRRCGYNLRGLNTAGACPECGTAIAQSLVGNMLRHADPEWLETLRSGASLKLWNIVLIIFGSIAAGLLVAAGIPATVLVVISLLGGLLGLWATFLITKQEPRIALQEDTVTLRTALRACAVAAFCGSLLQYVGAPTGMSLPVASAPVGAWYFFLALLSAVLSVAGIFVMWGELLYLRRFALRIPDDKLSQSTTLIMWVLPITGAVGLVFAIVAAVAFAGPAITPPAAAPAGPGPIAGNVLAVGACVLGAFALYLGLWYVRLLVRYRKAFATAAIDSRAATQAAVALTHHN